MADAPTKIPEPPTRPSPPRASRSCCRRSTSAASARRLLSFLLRMETLRRAVAGRLAAGAGLRRPVGGADRRADGQGGRARRRLGLARVATTEARHTIAFAYLVTVLLFARSGLYAERAQRPGLSRIVTSLFQVTVVALIFALVNGEQYSSYYIFYGTLVFAVDHHRLGCAGATSASPARCCAPPATAAAPCSSAPGRHIEDVAHALTDEVHAPVEMVGFISLTPRPDNGLRSLGRIEDARRGARRSTASRR